jgi:hypothetical protein
MLSLKYLVMYHQLDSQLVEAGLRHDYLQSVECQHNSRRTRPVVEANAALQGGLTNEAVTTGDEDESFGWNRWGLSIED